MQKLKVINKFILKIGGIDSSSDSIYPGLSPSFLLNKIQLLNTNRPVDEFFDENTIFSPLIPTYLEGSSPTNEGKIPDLCNWIEGSPMGLLYNISLSFKRLIEKMNIPKVHRFYDSEILLKNELIPFSILQLTYKYHKILIDFEKSTFCNWHLTKRQKLGDEHIQANSFEELRQIKKEKNWRFFGFNRAVMKPEFESLDMLLTKHYGLLISSRFKETIESAGLTGIKIEECPTQFEINYGSDQKEKIQVDSKVEVSSTNKSNNKMTKVFYPKGIRFRNQAEVDKFQEDYPHCKEILGTVFIQSSDSDFLSLHKVDV